MLNEMDAELLNAVLDSRADRARECLRKGASPNTITSSDTPLLKVAVGKDDQEIVEILLTAGADPSAVDSSGYPSLADVQSITVARALIDAGADMNADCYKGRTQLERATRVNWVDLVELLLERGAQVPQHMLRQDYWDEVGRPALQRLIASHVTGRGIEAAMGGNEESQASRSAGPGISPL